MDLDIRQAIDKAYLNMSLQNTISMMSNYSDKTYQKEATDLRKHPLGFLAPVEKPLYRRMHINDGITIKGFTKNWKIIYK